MLIEDELAIFADGLLRYFDSTTSESAAVGTPYLIEDINDHIHDYSGVINISGVHQGSVIFTASDSLLKHVLWAMRILDGSPRMLRDLVGEIGNTISGNARVRFGDQFIVSVPKFIEGRIKNDEQNDSIYGNYVIPVVWRHSKANLIVNLDSSAQRLAASVQAPLWQQQS